MKFLLSPAILRPLFWLGLFIITGLSLTPVDNPSLTQCHADKINHVAAFVLLVLLLRGAYSMSRARTGLLLLGYGFLIESGQYVLPYRMFSLPDLGMDLVGILLGLLLVELFNSVNRART